nr:CRISPR-associated endonuclease Cas1 [Thermococcus sp. JdF3]
MYTLLQANGGSIVKYPLFITDHGRLERQSGSLVFVGRLEKRTIPLAQVSEVHCLARVSLTSGAVELLSEKRIPVHFYSTRGDYRGSLINDASPRAGSTWPRQSTTSIPKRGSS